MRKHMVEAGKGGGPNFRTRGQEIHRVEGFSDAVFGFGLTLLIVSLEVPKTFDDLKALMLGFIPFGLCFVVLFNIWHEHYTYFRRYSLFDYKVMLLNAALLFVVLFFVYPLKFMFNLLVNKFMLHIQTVHIGTDQARELFLIYGSGLLAVEIIFFLLYLHASRHKLHLEFTPVETILTTHGAASHLAMALNAALSMLLAVTMPERLVGFAGWAYFLIPIHQFTLGMAFGKRAMLARAAIGASE